MCCKKSPRATLTDRGASSLLLLSPMVGQEGTQVLLRQLECVWAQKDIHFLFLRCEVRSLCLSRDPCRNESLCLPLHRLASPSQLSAALWHVQCRCVTLRSRLSSQGRDMAPLGILRCSGKGTECHHRDTDITADLLWNGVEGTAFFWGTLREGTFLLGLEGSGRLLRYGALALKVEGLILIPSTTWSLEH